ncbi:tRNA-splicing ligase [Gymnopilus junonius]|uniref:3'-phosphate/5'-hydroxy nucleic acid ligase n=1 Tax=Gymnopilus junonius TaxID=109634 RepID=A0A9P5TSP8_GYMJU|nr:tRNA-splicing ligase [Gymnopilus junonius]
MAFSVREVQQADYIWFRAGAGGGCCRRLKKDYIEHLKTLGKTGAGLAPEDVTPGSSIANLVDACSDKQHIIQVAKNKFRVKALSSIFLPSGILLDDGQNIPESTKKNLGGAKSFIDDSAVKQLERGASLPGTFGAFLGCSIAAEGIYPALIGSDIGCGIALYCLSSARARFKPKKLASLLQGLDEPWSGSVSDWLSQYGIDRTSDFDIGSLGTVGSGNHFAEICTPEKVIEDSTRISLDIQEGALYLLGSRGLELASSTKKQPTIQLETLIYDQILPIFWNILPITTTLSNGPLLIVIWWLTVSKSVFRGPQIR